MKYTRELTSRGTQSYHCALKTRISHYRFMLLYLLRRLQIHVNILILSALSSPSISPNYFRSLSLVYWNPVHVFHTLNRATRSVHLTTLAMSGSTCKLEAAILSDYSLTSLNNIPIFKGTTLITDACSSETSILSYQTTEYTHWFSFKHISRGRTRSWSISGPMYYPGIRGEREGVSPGPLCPRYGLNRALPTCI
jgi:hypothetical protein